MAEITDDAIEYERERRMDPDPRDEDDVHVETDGSIWLSGPHVEDEILGPDAMLADYSVDPAVNAALDRVTDALTATVEYFVDAVSNDSPNVDPMTAEVPPGDLAGPHGPLPDDWTWDDDDVLLAAIAETPPRDPGTIMLPAPTGSAGPPQRIWTPRDDGACQVCGYDAMQHTWWRSGSGREYPRDCPAASRLDSKETK